MADHLFYRYYDEIYATKDYRSEVETILTVYRNIAGKEPLRVLDVGCGTGEHACHFSMKGIKVVGTDLDKDSILLAQKKALELIEPKPLFVCEDVTTLRHNGFDLAVSLFNVVSYIDDVTYLLAFFEAIGSRLAPGGMFFFDCWNGLAVITDPPRAKSTRLGSNGKTIVVETRPTVDLMEQKVHVSNRVRVTSDGDEPKQFEYHYTQYLWTPALLKNLLVKAGFQVMNISAAMRPEIRAEASTWKIMFTCTKGNRTEASRYESSPGR